MATDIARNRQPAPKLADQRQHHVYDLFRDGQKVKLPCKGRHSTITIVRFVPPSWPAPEGKVIAVGYEPIKPSALGFSIVERTA